MNLEHLKAFQDDIVSWAKAFIQKKNDMNPISFVLMYHGDIEKLRKVGGAIQPVEPKAWFSGLKDHDVIAVARAYDMTWEEKYNVVYHAIPEDKRGALDMLRDLGKQMNFENLYKHMCRPLMNVLDVNEKDVAALAVRQICDASDAFAVITAMVAWQASGEEVYKKYMESENKSLEEFSESIEVLHVTLESHAIQRNITIPIHRRPGKKRGEGKLKGWGVRDEMSSDIHPTYRYTGRFAEYLKPLVAKASA